MEPVIVILTLGRALKIRTPISTVRDDLHQRRLEGGKECVAHATKTGPALCAAGVGPLRSGGESWEPWHDDWRTELGVHPAGSVA